MAQNAWMKDVFGYMLNPVSTDEFFDRHHEKKALIVKRDEPGRFLDLLSIKRIDDIVSSGLLDNGPLDMTRADPPVGPGDYTFDNGNIDRGAVARQYQRGATLILPQLHFSDPVLANFCRALEAQLSCHVQTNIYLTPPDAQGFRTHYDDHDVFVLQIEGSKAWRLYDTPVENPYRGEGYQSGAHEIGDPVEEFVLEPGEIAYVPRGLMHDARTHGDGPSLHITVGLIVKTWADLMLEAVSEVALSSPEFRRALPAGYARPDFDRAEARAHFAKLVEAFSQGAKLDNAMDVFVDQFIRSRAPDTPGTIVNFATPLDSSRQYKLKPLVPWRFAGDGKEVVIITAGGEVRFPAEAEPGLHVLLDGGVVSESSFDALDEEQRRDTIQKLYAFGLVDPLESDTQPAQ